MKKKTISKQMLIKDARVFFRIAASLPFLLVPLVYLISVLFINTNIGEIIIAAIIFVVFAGLIGFRQIIKAYKILKYINSQDFVIEVDKVIDKIAVSERCRVILEYNNCSMNLNEWKKIKIGSEYYVFNLPYKETIIKSTNFYELDDELKNKIVDSHSNPLNEIEKYED